eukprot:755942-Hanusia_phi.AAC.3
MFPGTTIQVDPPAHRREVYDCFLPSLCLVPSLVTDPTYSGHNVSSKDILTRLVVSTAPAPLSGTIEVNLRYPTAADVAYRIVEEDGRD